MLNTELILYFHFMLYEFTKRLLGHYIDSQCKELITKIILKIIANNIIFIYFIFLIVNIQFISYYCHKY